MKNYEEIENLTNNQLKTLMDEIDKWEHNNWVVIPNSFLERLRAEMQLKYTQGNIFGIESVIKSVYQEIAWRTYDGRWSPFNVESLLETLSKSEKESLYVLFKTLGIEDIKNITANGVTIKIGPLTREIKTIRSSLIQAFRLLKACNIILYESRGNNGTYIRTINSKAFLEVYDAIYLV